MGLDLNQSSNENKSRPTLYKEGVQISCGGMSIFPIKLETEFNISYNIKDAIKINSVLKLTQKPNSYSQTINASGIFHSAFFGENGGTISLESLYLPEKFYNSLLGNTIEEDFIYVGGKKIVEKYFGIAFHQSVSSSEKGLNKFAYFHKCMFIPTDSDYSTHDSKISAQSKTFEIEYLPSHDSGFSHTLFSTKDQNVNEYLSKMMITLKDSKVESSSLSDEQICAKILPSKD